MIYSQPHIKYIYEPLEINRYNPYRNMIPIIPLNKKHSKRQLLMLKKYFNEIVLQGKLRGYSQWNFFNKNYNFITERYVVKLLNALPLIDWFANNFDIKIIYLIRHPIPTSLSIMRKNWKNTNNKYLYNPDFINKYLTEEMLECSNKIMKKGNNMNKFILEWCLKHLYPLSVCNKRDWLTITYEELLLKPRKMIDLICEYLDLPDREKMLKSMLKPSKRADNHSKKDIIMKGSSYLVYRWKKDIKVEIECEAMSILETFGIDSYNQGSIMPSEKFLHFGSLG